MPPDKQERPDHKAEALHIFLTGESELSISSPVSDSDDGQGDNHDAPRKSQATRLVELALEQFRPLLSDDGRPYAVALDGPNVARPLRGRNGLREHLAKDTPTSPTARSLPHQR